MTTTNGNHTYVEIKSQGEIWKKTLDSSSEQLNKLHEWLEETYDEVIFTGCGSTHYLSLAASKTWTYLTGCSARGIASSEIWYYPDYTFSKLKPKLVAISRSGETTETIHALDEFKKKNGNEGLVISCYPESSMVRTSSFTLMAKDAQEKSIAQTRSFSNMYILVQLLAAAASENIGFMNELMQLPQVFSALVSKNEELVKTIGFDKKYQHFVFLGSGVNYGLASETMLKMKEMSTSISEVFNFMEFRHGPMSVISNESLVIGFISDSRKKEEMKVLSDMNALGATTLALIEDEKESSADFTIGLESGISELARGVLYLPMLQLLAYYHALSKDLDPDKPKNLSSVVYL